MGIDSWDRSPRVYSQQDVLYIRLLFPVLIFSLRSRIWRQNLNRLFPKLFLCEKHTIDKNFLFKFLKPPGILYTYTYRVLMISLDRVCAINLDTVCSVDCRRQSNPNVTPKLERIELTLQTFLYSIL